MNSDVMDTLEDAEVDAIPTSAQETSDPMVGGERKPLSSVPANKESCVT